ncbi:MAG TPA: hypothetical protein VFD36_30115 [Kofleriaceae bacterium]|nr:hypothetical protein [Kofleriaceae bacterium]
MKWFRLQRLLLYAQENGRTRQDGKKPSTLYTEVRKNRLVVWARHWGLPRFAGAVLRFAVIGFALALPYLTRGWWLDEASVAAILFVGLALLITVALGLLGFFLGGAVARRRRLWFAALGVFHAAIQLGAPPLMTRYAALPALIWIALIWTGFGIAGWALYKRGLGAAVAVCISLTYPSHAEVLGNSSKLPVVRLCE